MRFVRLLWSLMRYRTMLAIVLFFFVSLLLHQADFRGSALAILATLFVLVGLHIAGTAWNDWADYQIDRVNLKGHRDRPLVAGTISRNGLAWVALATSCLTVLIAFIIGRWVGTITVILLVSNSQYSLPPLHIAYRQWIVPFYLPIGYVGAPLAFGYLLGSSHTPQILLCLGLYCLFVARVSLKDFRDRKGDKKFHKPTLILSHGKAVVCLLCAIMVTIGCGLIVSRLLLSPMSIVVMLFYGTSLVIIWRLFHESRPMYELLLIGLGARIGNGFIIAYLAYLLTTTQPLSVQSVLLASLVVIYGNLVHQHFAHPEEFKFGKKSIA